MGRTTVEAIIIGLSDSKRYSFLVDTTATGVVELDTYGVSGRVLAGRRRGKGFLAMVAPAPISLIRYELLQTMRMCVNPVTEQFEDIMPDDVVNHPPYML